MFATEKTFETREEWLFYRRNKIGASDSAIILAASPHKTRYQLWLDKTDTSLPIDEMSFIQAKGLAVEPKIAALFEKMSGFETRKANLEHDLFFASLDGITKEGISVEFKMVGKQAFDDYLEQGKIPEHHRIQVQHQMLLTEKSHAFYVVYNDERGEIGYGTVERDDELIKRIVIEGEKFHKLVGSRESPNLETRDTHVIATKEAYDLAIAYAEIDGRIKQLTEKKEELKEMLYKFVDEKKCSISIADSGVSITGFFKRGAVEYKQIKELQGVDLEPYRKASIFQRRISCS